MELQVGVKIILQNNEGKYLFLKRASEKDSAVDEYWDLPGGRINTGSLLFENLQRELSEETGLEIKGEPKLITVQDIIRPHKHIVRLTYSGFADGKVVLSNEHSEYKWINLNEVKNLEPMDQYFKEVFEKFLI